MCDEANRGVHTKTTVEEKTRIKSLHVERAGKKQRIVHEWSPSNSFKDANKHTPFAYAILVNSKAHAASQRGCKLESDPETNASVPLKFESEAKDVVAHEGENHSRSQIVYRKRVNLINITLQIV
jgi:hypothetical protein